MKDQPIIAVKEVASDRLDVKIEVQTPTVKIDTYTLRELDTNIATLMSQKTDIEHEKAGIIDMYDKRIQKKQDEITALQNLRTQIDSAVTPDAVVADVVAEEITPIP